MFFNKVILDGSDFKNSPLSSIHLTPPSYNLSALNFKIIHELYKKLNYSGKGIDDIVFDIFLHKIISDEDINTTEIFHLFDIKLNGAISFNEFYLLVQILIAIRDNQISDFFNANSRVIFDLLDEDCIGMIQIKRINSLSFLLNMHPYEIEEKFRQHDTSKNDALDYEEFKIFVLDCVNTKKSFNDEDKNKENNNINVLGKCSLI